MTRTVVACQPCSLSRSATSRRTWLPGLYRVELALGRTVAVEVDLALQGLDEPEATLAIDHAHGAVQRYLVHLDLAPVLARVVLELAHRSVEGSRIAT